jgi:hypothetical protein
MALRERLVQVALELGSKYREELEQAKQSASDLAREDFVWHSLLEGMATMGSAKGYDGLIDNRENYDLVRFETLAALSPDDRPAHIEQALSKAKVRWARVKAGYLASNVLRLLDMGGPAAARDALMAAEGREGKIKFLSSFAGIGPKYARSVLMGAYHEEFRDCLALDTRIQKVTDALGLKFTSYQAHEDFYVDVAHKAGLNGWELDRILYYHTGEVLDALK